VVLAASSPDEAQPATMIAAKMGTTRRTR
jgi:hypothetical protein